MDASNDCKFKCKRCNYVAKNAFLLTRHLQRKSICKPIDLLHDIAPNVLIDELISQKETKQLHKCRVCGKGLATYQSRFVHEKAHMNEILINNDFSIDKLVKIVAKKLQNKKYTDSIANETNKDDIKSKLHQLYENGETGKNEKFFQVVVEHYLNGTHKRLSVGITDVTTESIHAEIKRWGQWKDGLGQLIAYNHADPKNELQLYFFGKYRLNSRQRVIRVLKEHNIRAFTFHITGNVCAIIDAITNEEIFAVDI